MTGVGKPLVRAGDHEGATRPPYRPGHTPAFASLAPPLIPPRRGGGEGSGAKGDSALRFFHPGRSLGIAPTGALQRSLQLTGMRYVSFTKLPMRI